VGFMACGKSSVGRQLAQRLDWDFVDLDTHIETRERQTIAEIFRLRGELGFRAAEASALRELTESLQREPLARNTVVALGGGTFAQLPNLELLRPWPTVFLDAPVDDLWQRTLEDAAKRPLRGDRTEFARLHHERLPFYRQARVTIVTSGKDPDSLCAEIESTLHSWGKLGQEEFDPGKMVQRKAEAEKTTPSGSYPSPRDYSGTGETK